MDKFNLDELFKSSMLGDKVKHKLETGIYIPKTEIEIQKAYYAEAVLKTIELFDKEDSISQDLKDKINSLRAKCILHVNKYKIR